jgi:type I restriction enzyme S subunit
MKRKGISTTENTENAEVDAVASVRSVVNTEDLPDNFQMTELGPLPKEWRVVRLEEVLFEVDVRVRELAPDASHLPVLSLTKNDGLVLQTERFGKRIATDDVSDYKVVRRGQIVNNPYVIWEGAVHILSKYEAGLVSPVYPVWEVKTSVADGWFIDHLLRMPATITAYNRFAAGAVNRRRAIRKSDFLSIQIPLPPLPEQRAIAHVLRTVQRAKEATEGVIAALKELKKSLMQHLFTYGPVPVTERKRVPLQETEIGPIPAHWRVVKFDQAITRATRVPKVKQSDYQPIGLVPIIDQGQSFIAGYTDKSPYKDNLPVIIFGDHTRVLKFVDFPFVAGADGTQVLIPNSTLFDPLFVYYALSTIDIPSRGYNRHFSLLRESSLPLPPLDEQREIARMLQAVDAKIAAEQTRRAALEDLFKTLLHELMSGRRRVSLATQSLGE